LIIKRIFGFAKVQLSRYGEERQQVVRRSGAGESVHGSTPSVATFAGEVRLMNGKWG